MSFPTSNNISMSVKNPDYTLAFLKAVYNANPGAKKSFAASSLCF